MSSDFINTFFARFRKVVGSRRDKFYLLSAFILILFYYLPYFILGKNSTLLIHDNLDSNLTWVKILINNNGEFLSPFANIDQVLNTLPRSAVYGTYDISLIWFKLLGMFWGYVVNKVISSLVGFLGMYFLLKKHFLPNSSSSLLPCAIALIFALLPFWSFTLTVSGIPILIFAFLNIRSGQMSILNWLIIGLFPFYSSLILSGFFIMIIFLGILIYDFILLHKISYRAFLALILLGFFYIISHLPLFYSFLSDDGFVSHRTEFLIPSTSFNGSLIEAFKLFLFGQYHAESLHLLILIPVLLFGFICFKNRKINLRFVYIFIFLILTSILYGYINWNAITSVMSTITAIFPIQFNRFHFLHPAFWYILLAICLYGIINNLKNSKTLVGIFLLLQFIYVISYHEIYRNSEMFTFKQFYSTEQFNRIQKFIKKPQNTYRVISLGVHPAVAQYNGFYTLDGYFPNYPLTYKHEFRKIIAKELEKNSGLKKYYDNWGSRIYAFSAEFGKPKNTLASNSREIENLEFNFEKLKELGGEYILSSVKINNNQNIEMLKFFANKDEGMDIYLYHIL